MENKQKINAINQKINAIINDKCKVLFPKNDNRSKIIEIAETHNFYPFEIKGCFIINNKVQYELYDWGFVIFQSRFYTIDCYSFEFIFIFPKHRRTGILTELVNKLKKEYNIITFTSKEKSMVYFAEKENFKKIDISRSKDELWFAWSETYSKDEIRKLY